MLLGISTYAYRWALGGDLRFKSEFELHKPLDIYALIEKVSDLGLNVLQICENISLNLDESGYRMLSKYASKKKVILEWSILDRFTEIEPYIVERNAKIAKLVGSNLLRVYPPKREPIESFVKRIKELLPILRKYNVRLAIENTVNCLYSSEELVKIFEEVNDPFIGACVDPVNSIVFPENPLETAKKLSPYAFSFHLKDFCIERKSVGEFRIFGVPLGEGKLPLRHILDIIKESPNSPSIILEQWMDKKGSIIETLEEEEKWIKKSVKFLLSIINEK
ncbi:MAG: sugar phosphate isomerase/epimerase family protein [Candidatus Bathyarchaeia archaeon]